MLGKEVKLLREQKNMTQEYVSLLEKGVKYPGLNLGVALARVLGTTVEQLVAG